MKKPAIMKKVCIILGSIIALIMIAIIAEILLLYILVSKPSDYYQPVLEARLVDIEDNRTYEYTINHKYSGKYAMRLFIPNHRSLEYPDSADLDLAYQVSIVNNKENLLTKMIDTSKYDGVAWSNEGAYISLFEYSVPETIPKGESLNLEIKVIHRGDKFIEKYGVPLLTISAQSTI